MDVLQKEALLQGVDEVTQSSANSIDVTTILATFGVVMFVFVLFLPKIYLSKNIYYESAKIDILKDRYYSLKEENNILSNRIEKIKFNNRVTH
jgi:hypothetical protein